MKRKALAVGGLTLTFLLLGGTWVGLLRLLPEGTPYAVAVLLLGVVVVIVYVSLLVGHVGKILSGQGRFLPHAALVLAELALLLAGFGAIYSRLGILDNTQQGSPVVYDFWKSMYLSVMTFTTVGYGDFYPTTSGRALAALEGLTGYVVLGILASSAASMLSSDDDDQGDETEQ